jgi:hypothetical protein
MADPKTSQKAITSVIDAVRWTARGDAGEATAETRKRARQCGPDAIAFLNYVMRSDAFASIAQRVRAATTLLEVGQFLSFEAKETGLFGAAEADGAGEREAT